MIAHPDRLTFALVLTIGPLFGLVSAARGFSGERFRLFCYGFWGTVAAATAFWVAVGTLEVLRLAFVTLWRWAL